MTIQAPVVVVGGIYRELCMHPRWDEFFGSGGRAAAALAARGIETRLHAYADSAAQESFSMRAALDGIRLHLVDIPATVRFQYVHGLSTPVIEGVPDTPYSSLQIRESHVLRFGMIEGDAVVHAQRAVYDPQNAERPQRYGANGSTAEELALVLNRREAQLLLGRNGTAEEMADALLKQERAAVIVIKDGPMGAVVNDRAEIRHVPAFRTRRVWKIGSGDNFAAHFAGAWLGDGMGAHEAAEYASHATAYFCEHHGSFPSDEQLAQYEAERVVVSQAWRRGEKPILYLAGPFFCLPQLWLVEQARALLKDMGLIVFSPYHDVGRGCAEDVVGPDLSGIERAKVLLALVDGLDPGTVFEVGYARALQREVVVYAECESSEDLKMMQGSGCIVTDDFVSAVYHTVWQAMRD